MPRLEHYPFRYRDPRTGKWVRAGYKTDLQTIAERHAVFEITRPPDMIDLRKDTAYFNVSGLLTTSGTETPSR